MASLSLLLNRASSLVDRNKSMRFFSGAMGITRWLSLHLRNGRGERSIGLHDNQETLAGVKLDVRFDSLFLAVPGHFYHFDNGVAFPPHSVALAFRGETRVLEAASIGGVETDRARQVASILGDNFPLRLSFCVVFLVAGGFIG